MTRAFVLALCLALFGTVPAAAQGRPQTLPPPPPGVPPQPVGRTSDAPPDTPAPATPTTTPRTEPARPRATPASPASTTPAAPATRSAAAQPAPKVAGEPEPTEQMLGVPIYPGARFLRSYDAGQGQRYYLFGATASYADMVSYYRNALRERGDEVYDAPPVHMFEVGRFREQSMAFPPGVTVKDYTWGGNKGYLVPMPGAVPDRYPTIIQIVPVTER